MWDDLMLSVIPFRLLSQIKVKWDARELMITLSRESFLTPRPKYSSPNDRPISLKAACCAFTKRSFQKQFNLRTIWTGCILLCKEEITSNWIILGLSRARALKALQIQSVFRSSTKKTAMYFWITGRCMFLETLCWFFSPVIAFSPLCWVISQQPSTMCSTGLVSSQIKSFHSAGSRLLHLSVWGLPLGVSPDVCHVVVCTGSLAATVKKKSIIV